MSEEKNVLLKEELAQVTGGWGDSDEDVCPKCGSTNVILHRASEFDPYDRYRCEDCGHSWKC